MFLIIRLLRKEFFSLPVFFFLVTMVSSCLVWHGLGGVFVVGDSEDYRETYAAKVAVKIRSGGERRPLFEFLRSKLPPKSGCSCVAWTIEQGCAYILAQYPIDCVLTGIRESKRQEFGSGKVHKVVSPESMSLMLQTGKRRSIVLPASSLLKLCSESGSAKEGSQSCAVSLCPASSCPLYPAWPALLQRLVDSNPVPPSLSSFAPNAPSPASYGQPLPALQNVPIAITVGTTATHVMVMCQSLSFATISCSANDDGTALSIVMTFPQSDSEDRIQKNLQSQEVLSVIGASEFFGPMTRTVRFKDGIKVDPTSKMMLYDRSDGIVTMKFEKRV